VQHKRHVHLIY